MFVLLLTLFTASAAQARPLYITLTFDDGLYSQYTQRDLLDEFGYKATFFVNTGNIRPPYNMSFADLNEMEDEGHEVGGHTVNHVNLTTRTTREQTQQICDDRRALLDNGIDATNFAYPFGGWNTALKTVVRDCGYDTARTTGGLDYPDPCCIFAETIPAADPYTLRAGQPNGSTPLSVMRESIAQARDAGGGWFMIVLHDVCPDDCSGWNSYAIRRSLLHDLFEWMAADPAVRVRTTKHMVAVGRDTTPPTATLTTPGDGATLSAGPVSLEATASDSLGIERVEFRVDGRVVATDVSAPYAATWDASSVAGSASIVARAYDEKGNFTDSSAHRVTIGSGDRTPPTVSLGYVPLTVAGTVGMTATASDASGIDRLEWLVDGRVVATDPSSPYEATWDTTSLIGSSANVTARAWDRAGNSATTAIRRVSVVAPSSSTRPVVSLVPPAGGTTVRGNVDLVADVSSSPTTVSFVEFLVDGVSIGIDWGAAFHEWWSTADATGSTVSVVARAIDVNGVAAVSSPMVLTIAR